TLDITGPIKEWFERFRGWWDRTIVPAWNTMVGGIGQAFSGIDTSGFRNSISGIGDWFTGMWEKVQPVVEAIVQLFGPSFEAIFAALRDNVGPVLSDIGERFGPLWETIKQFADSVGEFFATLWTVLQPVLAWIGGTLVAALSVAFGQISNIVGQVIRIIGAVISGVVSTITAAIKIVQGVIRTVTGIIQGIIALFKGDWEGVGEAWSNIWRG